MPFFYKGGLNLRLEMQSINDDSTKVLVYDSLVSVEQNRQEEVEVHQSLQETWCSFYTSIKKNKKK